MGTEKVAVFTHQITVSKKEERINFQLVLPSDTGKVVALHAVATRHVDHQLNSPLGNFDRTHAGELSLRWRSRGDIFLQQRVDLESKYHSGLQPTGIPSPGLDGGELWTSGRSIRPLDVQLNSDQRFLQGYYKDQINQLSGVDRSYSVTLHFYYHRKA